MQIFHEPCWLTLLQKHIFARQIILDGRDIVIHDFSSFIAIEFIKSKMSPYSRIYGSRYQPLYNSMFQSPFPCS